MEKEWSNGEVYLVMVSFGTAGLIFGYMIGTGFLTSLFI